MLLTLFAVCALLAGQASFAQDGSEPAEGGGADATVANDDAELYGGMFLPEAVGVFGEDVDFPLTFITWTSIISFVIVSFCLFYFSWKYRQRDKDYIPHGAHHNTPLEITWSVIPGILLIAFFVLGFRGFLDAATPPEGAMPVTARAWKWGWGFTYPNGYEDTNLHIPHDTPILVTNVSDDVIHSLYIPVFRVKKDVVPGRFNQMWFQAEFNDDPEMVQTETIEPLNGEPYTLRFNRYDLYCTEYCGTSHSNMNRKVRVYAPGDFEKWIAGATVITNNSPVKAGEKLWAGKCQSCHSIDGSAGTGPTWQNLWGNPNHSPATGTVGEEYIKESVEYPQAKIVPGYPANGMNPWLLSDTEYIALFEFMKSISTHYTGPKAENKEDWLNLLPQEEGAEGDAASQPDAAGSSTDPASSGNPTTGGGRGPIDQ